MNIDQWPMARTADFVAAYRFDGSDIAALVEKGSVDACPDTDQLHILRDIWGTLSTQTVLRAVILQGSDTKYVLSGHGGLMICGRPGLNLGLVFKPLFALEQVSVCPPDHVVPNFFDRVDATLWQVLSRIARCEVPRRLEINVDGQTIIIDAGPDGFGIVSGVADIGAFVSSIRNMVKPDIRYTLSDIENPTPRSADATVMLIALGSEQADAWTLQPDQWPSTFPQNANLIDLMNLVQVASRLSQLFPNDPRVTLTGYDAARQRVMSARFTKPA